MQQLIQPYDQVFCSAGVHPDYADASEPSVEILCELAVRDKVVAIGETGLDYFHQSGELDWQRARFITHIEAARSCGLPLIVHTRDARKDTLDLLRRHKADEVGGVLHCFTEDWEMASAAIDLGFYRQNRFRSSACSSKPTHRGFHRPRFAVKPITRAESGWSPRNSPKFVVSRYRIWQRPLTAMPTACSA